jgi:hypothetical protein
MTTQTTITAVDYVSGVNEGTRCHCLDCDGYFMLSQAKIAGDAKIICPLCGGQDGYGGDDEDDEGTGWHDRI